MTLPLPWPTFRIDVGRRCPIVYNQMPVVTLIGARAAERLLARDVASAFNAIQRLAFEDTARPDSAQSLAISPEDIAMAMLTKGSWARPDSNREPAGYEPDALPLSYGPVPREVYGC